MKSDKSILVAFLLNFLFSIFEFVGGAFTNSVSIISDAIHDLGDSFSIGIAYLLEKKSKKKPDDKYTYGYVRYSVIGGLITTIILLIGSIFVIYNAVIRIFNPVDINYNGMIILAVIGVVVNVIAVRVTKGGNSLNQKSVNLHMLEDVLGWIIVLIGAVIMKFSDFVIIDPILSIIVAIFILVSALKNIKLIIDIFMEKTPNNIDLKEIKKHLLEIDGVIDIHHIHVWSIDGYNNYATMHVVVSGNEVKIKHLIKDELSEHGVRHTTIEIEKKNEECCDKDCVGNIKVEHHHHHH